VCVKVHVGCRRCHSLDNGAKNGRQTIDVDYRNACQADTTWRHMASCFLEALCCANNRRKRLKCNWCEICHRKLVMHSAADSQMCQPDSIQMCGWVPGPFFLFITFHCSAMPFFGCPTKYWGIVGPCSAKQTERSYIRPWQIFLCYIRQF